MTGLPVTRRAALALALLVPLLLGGCAGSRQPATGGGQVVQSNVDVDTPQLRALKRQAGVATCPSGGATRAGEVAGGMPDTVLPCLGGGPSVKLSSLRGPMVVNLWAQWCGPCRQELPFYEKLHRRAGDRVRVLGIDYQDTQPQAALELARATGVTYPLLADPNAELRRPFRVLGLPGVLLIDRRGRVAHLQYTVIRSYPQLTRLVRDHLGVDL
jgi:thiol-disulfide isomerase/thioredoxin